MNKINLPIETTQEGTKITKVCVEDVYKVSNRILEKIDNVIEKIDSIHKDYQTPNGTVVTGELVIGKGVSQPCITDAFDEEIGNNLSFMKAKFNASCKKLRWLKKILNSVYDLEDAIGTEIDNIGYFYDLDLHGIRRYNPDFRK